MSASKAKKKGGSRKGEDECDAAEAQPISLPIRSAFFPSHTDITKKKIIQSFFISSLTGKDFIDTRFDLFSLRTRSGVVTRSRPVFASSAFLKTASSHFKHRKSDTVFAVDLTFT